MFHLDRWWSPDLTLRNRVVNSQTVEWWRKSFQIYLGCLCSSSSPSGSTAASLDAVLWQCCWDASSPPWSLPNRQTLQKQSCKGKLNQRLERYKRENRKKRNPNKFHGNVFCFFFRKENCSALTIVYSMQLKIKPEMRKYSKCWAGMGWLQQSGVVKTYLIWNVHDE